MTEHKSLETIVKERFGFHRGFHSKERPENSLEAIKAALPFEPYDIEFDVTLVGSELWTGHPPQKPLDRLEEVLPLFKGKKTYPKVDLKLDLAKPCSVQIDPLVDRINRADLAFVLVNMGGVKRLNYQMKIDAQDYFAAAMRGNERVRLNVDLANFEDQIGGDVKEYINGLGGAAFSTCPEIYESDWEVEACLAEGCEIPQIHFHIWPRDWPDVPEPQINEGTIREALVLEERYPIKVYFDMDPRRVESLDLKRLGFEG